MTTRHFIHTEFVAFFEQICGVCYFFSVIFVALLSCSGDLIHARESHRSSVFTSLHDAIHVSDLVFQGLHITKHRA